MKTKSVAFAAACAIALLTAGDSDAAGVDSATLVAAFAEVCVPECLSHAGTLALAESLGWRPATTGISDEFDRIMAIVRAEMRDEAADGIKGEIAFLRREFDGHTLYLSISLAVLEYINLLGCHLHDLAATEPVEPAPVSELLGIPPAYTTSEQGDFFVDPKIIVSTVWGPSPKLPRTLDTYLTYIPTGSSIIDQTGFDGVALKFSTSVPAE